MLAQATLDEVPELLIRYQALRHGRTARFQRRSRRIIRQQLGQHDRRFPELDDIIALDWAYDHDAQQAAALARG